MSWTLETHDSSEWAYTLRVDCGFDHSRFDQDVFDVGNSQSFSRSDETTSTWTTKSRPEPGWTTKSRPESTWV